MATQGSTVIAAAILILCSAPLRVYSEQEPNSRFEYKYSFKPPKLVTTSSTVPFWNYFGNVLASEEQIRLTTSVKDQKGMIWTENKSNFSQFEIEVSFRVSGRGRIGGDGLAVWYTESLGLLGQAFGSSERWKGLGVLFDSFDNDQAQNNPYIMVLVNDGSVTYNHHNDGSQQSTHGCMQDFRNTRFPVRVKIRYFGRKLSVMFHQGRTDGNQDFIICSQMDNVDLPPQGYFGVSAATGGLADDHDVIQFITHSLTDKKQAPSSGSAISEEERRSLEKKYAEYSQQYEKKKEEYHVSHPEKFSPEEKAAETSYERDVRLIYEGQLSIHRLVNNLHGKSVELVNQVNSLQQIAMEKLSGCGSVTRNDVTTLVNMQNQIGNAIADVRNSVTALKNAPTDDAAGTRRLDDIHAALPKLMERLNAILAQVQAAKPCPPPPPPVEAVSTGTVFFLLLLQTVVICCVLYYKGRQETMMKKFY